MSQIHSLELEAAATDLVKRLGGRWSGKGGMCHCPAHDDRNPSLSVRIGTRSLLLKCFAGCDILDVLRAIRRLNLDVPTREEPLAPNWQPREDRIAARARELWDGALPFAGSPAQIYARARGLLGLPATLRYHPRTPLGDRASVRFRPALLAAVRSRQRIVAVERLFLDCATGLPVADLVPPKRMLGRPRDGAVRFGLPDDIVGLAEGWETAWSAHILLGIPVWACLGSERFAHVAVPESVERLILLPDNDLAGEMGTARALEAHVRPGRTIEVRLPDCGFNDWNDQIRGGGKEVGMGVRKAA